MKTKRTLAWLLTLLTIGSTLLACGGDGDGGKETDGKGTQSGEQTSGVDTVDTANMTETQKRQLVDDGIETVDYNQRPFRLSVAGHERDTTAHYLVEAETGDPCADAIWKRNSKVEGRFNILIEESLVEDFDESILTDQKEVELGTSAAWRINKLTTQNLIYDWNDVEVINPDQPWYNKLSNDESTLMGTLYGICSEMSISSMTFSYGMFFNTRLIENYGIDKAGLYDMVDKGTWTIDKMIELTKGVYEDINQDNTKNDEDLFGFACGGSNSMDVWLTAFGHKLTTKAEDGTLILNFATEKTESALAKLRDWRTTDGVITGASEPIEMFVDGRVLFVPMEFERCFAELKEMEDVYSVLPYPKWDENQTDYYTNANDNYELFVLPKTLNDEDLEFVGSIFEVLSAETWKTVSPVYYDAALKGRYSKEPETAKMIDIIMNGRNFEFSFQYAESHLGRISYLFRDLLKEPKTPLASKWITAERLINAKIAQGFYDLFTD
ncbi:MAG: hypothetical protein IJC98_00170 [Clostridia bacterium]|nr:hypothetical protein [Clostridia bacterium]